MGEFSDDVFGDLGLGAEETGGEYEEQEVAEYDGTEAEPEYETEGPASDEELDANMSEAVYRLNLAEYYKRLLKGGLFGAARTREAQQVDEEVRQFALGRMNELIGLGSAKPKAAAVEPPFSDEQIEALRQIADRLLGQSETTAIRPLAPPKPAPRVQAPRSMVTRPQQAPKPAPRPVAAQARPGQPQPPKARPGAPAAQPQRPGGPKKPPAKKQERDLEAYELDVPFEENGRTYKVTISPRPDEDGRAKRVLLDVTPQVRPPSALPTPTRQQANYMSMAHAHSVIDSNPALKEMTRAAAIVMSE